MYQEIFKQGKIGNITLKNRLVKVHIGVRPHEEEMIFF